MCVCVSVSKRARASDEAHIRDARNAILVSLLPSSVCMCWVHCTMRLFPVFLNLSYYLLCVCRLLPLLMPLFPPILQFDCGFQQIKFMAMAKRTKIPYLYSLKCQTIRVVSLCLSLYSPSEIVLCSSFLCHKEFRAE